MTILQLLFYAFSMVTIGSALMVVISRNSVIAALFLVLTFVSAAGLWMLLHAEFLSLILVLVYVGAVMTLFLFVVMMLSVQGAMKRETFVRYLPLGALVVLAVVAVAVMVLSPYHFGLTYVAAPDLKGADYNNIADLGSVLYTDYAYPFEVGGVLLLAAIIAAISLTHRPSTNRKAQNPNEQIKVRPEDRLRLVRMPFSQKNKSLEP